MHSYLHVHMSYVYNYAIMHTGFVSWLACCSCINICRKDGSTNLCHTLHCCDSV